MSNAAYLAEARYLRSRALAKRRARSPVSVGDPANNASARDNDGERPCECGYSVCSKRGPCAPPAAAPVARRNCYSCGVREDVLHGECMSCAAGRVLTSDAPAPLAHGNSERASARDPYEAAGHPWARVGMRVQLAPGETWSDFTPARSYEVLSPRNAVQASGSVLLVDNDGDKRWVLSSYFEPIADAPQAGFAVGDPIAECERLSIDVCGSDFESDVWCAFTSNGTVLVPTYPDHMTDKRACAALALDRYHARGARP